jgi:hypothetical protein
MRRTAAPFALFAAALAFSAVSSPAAAQEVTGTWELSWETPQGARTVTFTFAQSGMTVTGTALMGRADMVREVPIQNGMLHGDQLTFTLTLGMGERVMAQTFAATVKGDAMEGKVTTMRGEMPFTGARKKS